MTGAVNLRCRKYRVADASELIRRARLHFLGALCGLFFSLVGTEARATCMLPNDTPPPPVLHSKPGAVRILLLDFDGYCEDNYRSLGLPVETWPPFDVSADANAIRDIWERVAEDFAPFDVDVTTQTPSNMDQNFFWQSDSGQWQSGIRIVIANGDFLRAEGLSPDHPRTYNIAYVDQLGTNAQGMLSRRVNRSIAQTISHEAGHTFSYFLSDTTGAPVGLVHYATGSRTAAHDLSAQQKTQILGPHLDHRSIWWKDPLVEVALPAGGTVLRPQEDMMVLWAATGFRSDDHRDQAEFATPLRASGAVNTFTASGVITKNAASFPSSCALWGDPAHPFCYVWRQANGATPQLKEDKDFFRFRTANPGIFELRALTINNPGSDLTRANLDADIELWRKSPDGPWARLPEAAFTRLSLPDHLSVGLSVSETSSSGAEYAVAVKSEGAYGDLGQYTLTATGSIVREAVDNLTLDDPKSPGFAQTTVHFAAMDSTWLRISSRESRKVVISAELLDAFEDGYVAAALLDARMGLVAELQSDGKPVAHVIARGETYFVRASGKNASARIIVETR